MQLATGGAERIVDDSLFSAARLKQVPEDFEVSEVPIAEPQGANSVDRERSMVSEWLLRKRDLTTFEALALVSKRLGVSQGSIGYAGLKDELAVTSQRISIHADLTVDSMRIVREEGRYADVSRLGVRGAPLDVGDLLGNVFRIRLRNIPQEATPIWPAAGTFHFEYLNYYDTQRFGVPGGPRTTHLIGAHLERGEYDAAFDLLVKAKTAESVLAEEHSGSPRSFFEDVLDPRVVGFYRSSYHSFEWNAGIARRLQEAGNAQEVQRDRIRYYFPKSRSAPEIPHSLPYVTVRVVDGTLQRLSRSRLARVGVSMNVAALEPDELNPGMLAGSVRFFLPSGAYATMAVAQFLRILQFQAGGVR